MVKENINYFGNILKTKDYGMFNKINCNRKLNPVNYSKLLRSMKEEQLIIPICVNEKFEVIDGQHRLKVGEELNLPVYFYVLEGYTVSQMKRANLVSANWKKDDFLNAYITEKNSNYLDFADMKERYGVNTSDLIKIISKIQKTTSAKVGLDFEEGNLEITPENKAEITMFLLALQDFSFFKYYRHSKFIGAFIQLYFFEGYNHEQMKMRLKTRAHALEEQKVQNDYLELLTNKIYSFGATKNNIYFNPTRSKEPLYALN